MNKKQDIYKCLEYGWTNTVKVITGDWLNYEDGVKYYTKTLTSS